MILHDFIVANRDEIIERTLTLVRERTPQKSIEAKLEHGVPLFLTQLLGALARRTEPSASRLAGTASSKQQIADSAGLHGHELLRGGFTVAQVVHGYGDVCQAVTALADETHAAISADDFHVFNRSLDEAIAAAVTAYESQHERDLASEDTVRLGMFTHELRNQLGSAILAFDLIRRGTVGVSGSTGGVLARSLTGLSALIDRALSQVRLESGTPPTVEPISIVEFIEETAIAAAMQADAHGVVLGITPIEDDVVVNADRQLLASSLANLLQNAFKFTRRGGTVTLTVHAPEGRVLLEVSDECGGLPPGKAQELFRPFSQKGGNRSGLGLGLSIALSAAKANGGDIRVRDVPGKGCVFALDLPRAVPSPARTGTVRRMH
ncbi:MAG TPA: HAMP domain-containing sensor histidine kinase [Polyangiaceae bacterium]|nr:HAMP domain-containing sensor histidine kinase [Polyangiaceae bacterium]